MKIISVNKLPIIPDNPHAGDNHFGQYADPLAPNSELIAPKERPKDYNTHMYAPLISFADDINGSLYPNWLKDPLINALGLSGINLSAMEFVTKLEKSPGVNALIEGNGIATLHKIGLVKASKEENRINVDSNSGIMEVNSLNVNKLVQTEGDELIIEDGNADF